MMHVHRSKKSIRVPVSPVIKQILSFDLAGGFGSLEGFEVSPVDSDWRGEGE